MLTKPCTPHTSASRRAVATLGVIAMTGGFGRSRATRSAVAPDEVPQTIAAMSRYSAISLAAAAMASAPVGSGGGRWLAMTDR